MRINERFELLEDKIRQLEKEVEALKAGKDQTGKAETAPKARKAEKAAAPKTAAPKAKKATSK